MSSTSGDVSHHVSHHVGHHVSHDGTAVTGGFGCVEVITGARRRRDWSIEEKLAIIAESCATRSSISEVARRHGINRNQLFRWRAESRAGKLGRAAVANEFVPVAMSADEPARLSPPADRWTEDAAGGGGAVIDVIVGSMTVRIPPGADERMLQRVLGVVKTLA
jgi:transposase